MSGFCPGTVITSLPTFATPVLLLASGVIVGILGTWGAESALRQEDVTVGADF